VWAPRAARPLYIGARRRGTFPRARRFSRPRRRRRRPDGDRRRMRAIARRSRPPAFPP